MSRATETRGRADRNASPVASEEDEGALVGTVGAADEDGVHEELVPSARVPREDPSDNTPRVGIIHARPSGPSGAREGIGSRERPSGDRRANTNDGNRA